MIKHIARKEFTDVVRDGRFRWCAALVGALLLVSAGHGWVQSRQAQEELAAAQATAREHWESQGEKNPHSAAHYGIYAFKPRLALSFVDAGVDPYTGTSVWLEAHRQNDFLMRPAQDAAAAQRIGALTAAQVLQNLVPLLIILLTFRRPAGGVGGERTRGAARGGGPLQVDPPDAVRGRVRADPGTRDGRRRRGHRASGPGGVDRAPPRAARRGTSRGSAGERRGGLPPGERGVRKPDLRPQLRRVVGHVRAPGPGARGARGCGAATGGAHALDRPGGHRCRVSGSSTSSPPTSPAVRRFRCWSWAGWSSWQASAPGPASGGCGA